MLRGKTGVPTEPEIRAFLLGLSDAETEKTIEESLLDGSIAGDDMWVIEEELIDDHVFGRLSLEQESAFHTSFLASQERNDKLSFSRAIHQYAQEHPSAGRVRQGIFFGLNSRFVLASGLALFGLVAATAGWFGIRDARLSRELAQVSRASDERQRLLDSLMEEQKQPTRPTNASPVQNPAALNSEILPGIQLRPGVRRGLEAVPVIHVGGHASVIRITLELGFTPEGGLHEELLHAGGARIWIQELTSAGPVVSHGATTIYVPAQLLTPGDYQVRVKDLSAPSDEGDVYAFRVSRP